MTVRNYSLFPYLELVEKFVVGGDGGSAGARISAHGQKSKHLANRGAFVGGGFSLCTSAAKLG